MDALKAQRICEALLDEGRPLSETETSATLNDPESRKDVCATIQVHVLLQVMDHMPVSPGLEAPTDPAIEALTLRVMSAVQSRRRTHRRHYLTWAVAAAAAVIVISTLMLWPSRGQQVSADPSPQGIAQATSPQTWTRNGTTVLAGQSLPIIANDVLETQAGILTLVGRDGTKLTLSSNSRLRSAPEENKPWFLDEGQVHAVVAPQTTEHPMLFAVREGAIHMLGTVLDIIADPLGSRISVSSGSVSVAVSVDGLAHLVTSGHTLNLGAEYKRIAPPTGTGIEMPWLGHATPMPVFNDRLLQSSGWRSIRAEQPLTTTQRGWPQSPLPDGGVLTTLLTHMGAAYTPDEWTLTWAGKGTLSVTSWPVEGTEIQREAHRLSLKVVAGDGMQLNVITSDPADPVRDIRFLADQSQAADDLLPSFRADWTGGALVRTGAWSPPAALGTRLRWADRILPGDGPGSIPDGRAVAPELSIRAAEQLDAPLWWVVPIQADDSYIDGLAHLAVSRVRVGQPTLVSYSNADLPSADAERLWLQHEGEAAGHDPAVAAPRFAAERSLAVFARWRAVFASARLPLVCLVPGGDQTWNQLVSSWRRCGFHADAITVPEVQYLDCNALAGESARELTARLKHMTLAALREGGSRKAELDADIPPMVWLAAGVVIRTPFPMTEVTRPAIYAWWTDPAIQEAVAERWQTSPHQTRVLVDWADQYFQRVRAGVVTPGRPTRRDDILWLKRSP